jgi:hypothetical protein
LSKPFIRVLDEIVKNEENNFERVPLFFPTGTLMSASWQYQKYSKNDQAEKRAMSEI